MANYLKTWSQFLKYADDTVIIGNIAANADFVSY